VYNGRKVCRGKIRRLIVMAFPMELNFTVKEFVMKQRIIGVVAFLMLLWSLSGCNTIHGVGKDIESGGKAIERSSGK
jgi:entericidin B